METKEALETAKKYLSQEKDGAVWLVMMEAGELVNYSAIARKYFNKSGNWLLQRLHGYEVNGRPASFKPEEYATFTAALRDLARQLDKAAARIEAASQPA